MLDGHFDGIIGLLERPFKRGIGRGKKIIIRVCTFKRGPWGLRSIL